MDATGQNLQPVTVEMSTVPAVGTVTLSVPEGVKLWKDEEKDEMFLAPDQSKSWDLATEDRSQLKSFLRSGGRLYVEGQKPGALGNIELTYDASNGVVEDAVKVTGLEVEILRVPDYLFANAGYATPVSFGIPGIPDNVDLHIQSVDITFSATRKREEVSFMAKHTGQKVPAPGGGSRIVAERTAAAGGDISLADEAALRKREFETYIKPEKFQNLQFSSGNDDHWTTDAHFELQVTTMVGEQNIVLSSDSGDQNACVGKLFGDNKLPVIDIAADSSAPIDPPDNAVFKNVKGGPDKSEKGDQSEVEPKARATLVEFLPDDIMEVQWNREACGAEEGWEAEPSFHPYSTHYYWRTPLMGDYHRLPSNPDGTEGTERTIYWGNKEYDNYDIPWHIVPEGYKPDPPPALPAMHINSRPYWTGNPQLDYWYSWHPDGLNRHDDTRNTLDAYGQYENFPSAGESAEEDASSGRKQFRVKVRAEQSGYNYDRGTYKCENRGVSMGVQFYVSYGGRQVDAVGMSGKMVMDLEKDNAMAHIRLFDGVGFADVDSNWGEDAPPWGSMADITGVGAGVVGPFYWPAGVALAGASGLFKVLQLTSEDLGNDPPRVTDHNGIAQAEVSAHYNIGPDNFTDWDPDQGPGDFGKETRFWSAYRETSDGADNDQKNETQETPDRNVEVGQVFRGWLTLSCVVQLPAHDTFWWG